MQANENYLQVSWVCFRIVGHHVVFLGLQSSFTNTIFTFMSVLSDFVASYSVFNTMLCIFLCDVTAEL